MKVRFHCETIDDAMKTMFEPKDWDDFCKHLTNKSWDTNKISCKLYYDKPDRRIGWGKTWIISSNLLGNPDENLYKIGKKNATSLEWHMNCHDYYINNSFLN